MAYSPTLMRWMQQDPMGYVDGANRYQTTVDNPINGLDPTGLVLFAFNGTGNTPESETNVWTFYLKYNDNKYYYTGVGTGGWTDLDGTAWGSGVRARRDDAVHELDCYLTQHPKDKKLDIVGFSRGAATARSFANKAQTTLTAHHAEIRFIGVWDTVASMGLANNSNGMNMDLPASARGRAFHAMSLHENRSKFALTRYAGAKEVWFPGVHSDVGGGYAANERGYSNSALRWMMFHAKALGVPLNYNPAGNEFQVPIWQYVAHDEMRDSWANWLTSNYASRMTQVRPGDEFHVSFRAMTHQSLNDWTRDLHRWQPSAVVNNDDNWSVGRL